MPVLYLLCQSEGKLTNMKKEPRLQLFKYLIQNSFILITS